MPQPSYRGRYFRFEAPDKRLGSVLMGADCIVGDEFSLDWSRDESGRSVKLVNPYGGCVGVFGQGDADELHLMKNQGLELHVLLSFVAFSEKPAPGVYWGEVAVIGYKPSETYLFKDFVGRVAAQLKSGNRPDIDLSRAGVEALAAAPDTWMPERKLPKPDLKAGSVILKSKITPTERIIKKGRERRIGCYVVSWAFLLALVTAIAFAGHGLGFW